MPLSKLVKKIAKSSLFLYETPKVVVIESKCIGLANRLMQLTLFVAIIVWVFILNNGYQHIEGGIGGSTSKLKGVAFSNSTDPRVGKRIWDSADLHVPPQDNGAFFLTTNVIVTDNQVQSTCASATRTRADCSSDADCQPIGKPYHLGHGVSTGVCNMTTETCIISGWCPLEDDRPKEDGTYDVLDFTEDFTVLIKNNVYFPYYDKGRSNLIESIDKKYLYSCRYHPVKHPYCPIFRLGDVVSLAESKNSDVSDSYFRSMTTKGGVVSINIKWDCNFDYAESDCKPKYNFARLDNYQGSSIANGYNFRYPLIYFEDGQQKRQLVKAYGILFLLKTDAIARAYDSKTLFLNIGSSIALIGIATILSEILLLHLHRNRNYFKKFKIDRRVAIHHHEETKQANSGGSGSSGSEGSSEMSEARDSATSEKTPSPV